VKTRAERQPDVAARFLQRAERAEALAGPSEAGRAPLELAAGLYRAQAVLAAAIERAHGSRPLSGRMELDLAELAGQLEGVIGFAAERGPPGLREQARALAANGDRWTALRRFWNGSAEQDYLARALLRPYAEVLAALGVRPEGRQGSGGCPFCAGAPWIAERRAAAEGDGAQRFVHCALCAGEWPVNRISCPACGEQDPERLPRFHSDRYPAARIEACGSCRRYLKSIDLTVDARAIPEVDDLCSLSLDLWAREEGYQRLEPGLAGL
jgi:formate dehydrogenase maturation protein FdhE